MAITKIQSNAFPTSIDLSNIDLTIGANEIVTANIADNNVTHAKLHTDMDLTSKTVTLPSIASLTVSGHSSTQTLSASSYITVGSLVVNDPGSNYYSYNNRIGGNMALVGNLDVDGVVSVSVNSPSHETFRFTTQGVDEAKLIMKNASSQDKIVLNTNGNTWFDGGNVGIGTDSPETMLHVQNSSGFGGIQLGRDTGVNEYQYINFGGNTAGDAAWQIGKKNNSSDVVGPAKGFYVYDLAASAARLVIDTSGNVGIGTQSPTSSKLEIKTDAISSGSDNEKRGIKINTPFVTGYQNQIASLISGYDGAIFGTNIGMRYRNGGYEISLATNDDTDGEATERVIIDKNGKVIIDSISQGAEQSKLTIRESGSTAWNTTATRGTNTKGAFITLDNNENDMVGLWMGTGNGTHFSGITSGRTAHTSHWGTHLSFFTHEDNTSNINTATEKVRITGNGRVGIGTTTPAAPLQVNGNALANQVLVGDYYNESSARRVLGWHVGNATTAYRHIRTSLWGGGSTYGNSQYIMGGFHIMSYRYSQGSGNCDAWLTFHNWAGSVQNGYNYTYSGNWDAGSYAYVDSTGYVTLRLTGSTYYSHFVDVYQHPIYPVRDIHITNVIDTSSSSI